MRGIMNKGVQSAIQGRTPLGQFLSPSAARDIVRGTASTKVPAFASAHLGVLSTILFNFRYDAPPSGSSGEFFGIKPARLGEENSPVLDEAIRRANPSVYPDHNK